MTDREREALEWAARKVRDGLSLIADAEHVVAYMNLAVPLAESRDGRQLVTRFLIRLDTLRLGSGETSVGQDQVKK